MDIEDFIKDEDKKVNAINWEELSKKADKLTIDEIVSYMNELETVGKGYENSIKATGLAAVAAAWIMCKKLGLTGFQASCVNFEFLKEWFYSSNKSGIGIIDYDNMLYPQYKYKFEKTISEDMWNSIRQAAIDNIKEVEETHSPVSKRVYNHWKKIAEGKVPFGYKIIKNK